MNSILTKNDKICIAIAAIHMCMYMCNVYSSMVDGYIFFDNLV